MPAEEKKRQCCKSTFSNFDPRDVNMLPNHFCPPSRGKTSRITVVMVWEGWASFVMTIVFSGLRNKATRSNCLTHAAQRLPASTCDCVKNLDVPTKRASNKLGPPSIKLKPIFPTSALRSRIADCNTAQNKRGLSTHPCRTPPVILNVLICGKLMDHGLRMPYERQFFFYRVATDF